MAMLLRGVFFLLALVGLIGSVAIVLREPMTAIMLGAASVWTVVATVEGFLADPLGQRFLSSRSYQKVVDPFLVRPIILPTIRIATWLFHVANYVLEWAFENALNFLKWAAITIIGLIVIALLSLACFALLKGLVAIPVSIAILIGAVLIAIAIRGRV